MYGAINMENNDNYIVGDNDEGIMKDSDDVNSNISQWQKANKIIEYNVINSNDDPYDNNNKIILIVTTENAENNDCQRRNANNNKQTKMG